MALYPWLEPSLERWVKLVRQQSVPASVLLISKEGMGAEQLVEQMAAAVLCKQESAPCGFCHDCSLLAADSHPDLHAIRPEKGAKSISVEQIRQMNRLAQESSQLGGFRVITINPAESMNESAANALLKTLEEPAEQCCFILSASAISQLLPTIVSRCRQIQVPLPSQSVVMEWVSSVSGEAVSPYVVKLNGFSPLSTLAFMENRTEKECENVINHFISFLERPADELISMSSRIVVNTEQHLVWLWHLLVDAQKYHFSINQIDAIPHSARISEIVPYTRLYQQTQALNQLLQQQKQFSGLNSELLVTDWLLNFKG